MASTYKDPKWGLAQRVNDWRNHVPDEIKEMWDEFTGAQRLALFNWAFDLADTEDWD